MERITGRGQEVVDSGLDTSKIRRIWRSALLKCFAASLTLTGGLAASFVDVITILNVC